MALTIADGGSGNSVTNDTTLLSTGQTGAVGDVLYMFISASNDGTNGAASGITGILWGTNTGASVVETNYDPGAAGAGITLYIWKVVVTVAVAVSTQPAITFSANTSQKSLSCYKVTPGAGETVTDRAQGAGATGNSAAPTIAAASVASGDTIMGGLAAETDDVITGDSDSSNGSWSSAQQATADGGADAACAKISIQYKTTTGTGDQTYNPTINAARDYAINWITIYAETSTQTLTPSLFTDTDEFHSPTVTPGPVALTPDLFADGDFFHSATVISTYPLTPDLFTDDDTFHSPTVTPGVATVGPSLFEDGDTFFSPVVTPGAVNLTPPLFDDGDSFHSATVTASNTLTPELFDDGDTFYAATVTPGVVTLSPDLFDDGDAFHSATVSQGGGTQELMPDLFADGDSFYSATVVASYTLVPSLFTDDDTFFSPTVTQDGATQTLEPDLFVDADIFYGPTVEQAVPQPDGIFRVVTGGSRIDRKALGKRKRQTVRPGLFVNEAIFWPPTVTHTQFSAAVMDNDLMFIAAAL